MDHFATCVEYDTEAKTNWRKIKLINIHRQSDIKNIFRKE